MNSRFFIRSKDSVFYSSNLLQGYCDLKALCKYPETGITRSVDSNMNFHFINLGRHFNNLNFVITSFNRIVKNDAYNETAKRYYKQVQHFQLNHDKYLTFVK